MARINPIQPQKHLGGVSYPASKQDIVVGAVLLGGDDDVRSVLGELPDEEYETPTAVNKALGGMDDE